MYISGGKIFDIGSIGVIGQKHGLMEEKAINKRRKREGRVKN